MSHDSFDRRDDGNVLYRRQPHAPSPLESRRVIPSGDVSPDGKRNWPRSSLTSKILVYGGMGIAAAAATAGAVLAVRTVVDAIAGDDEDDALQAARRRAKARRNHPSSHQPAPRHRFASTAYPSQPAPARAAQDEDDAAERAARARARHRGAYGAPPRRHAQQASVVDSVNETVESLTSGVRDVLETVTAAIEGFRSVATQASGIMRQFSDAADQVKSILEPAGGAAARPRDSRSTRRKRDVVDLREPEAPAPGTAQGGMAAGTGAQDAGMQGGTPQGEARQHRL